MILDHLGRHKAKTIRSRIESAARDLWPPPYSPDPNPIEQSFAKIKHWIRLAQKRTLDETWRQVGERVDEIGLKRVRKLYQKCRIGFHCVIRELRKRL